MTATLDARRDLVRLLQTAHAAELAAFIAYHGHSRAVSDPIEKVEIRRIGREELRHRRTVRNILRTLGAAPAPFREATMPWIGRGIWLTCFLTGWFVPMYGAARLERNNVGEYVTAAHLAVAAGCAEHVDACLEMAAVEWDHEAYFHRKARESRLMRFAPDWPDPAPRASIRERFAAEYGDGANIVTSCVEPGRAARRVARSAGKSEEVRSVPGARPVHA